jgi:hypothetical protein
VAAIYPRDSRKGIQNNVEFVVFKRLLKLPCPPTCSKVGSKDGHLVFIERHGRPDDIARAVVDRAAARTKAGQREHFMKSKEQEEAIVRDKRMFKKNGKDVL